MDEETLKKLQYFDLLFNVEKCNHCGETIYVKKKDSIKLYKKECYRRCGGFHNKEPCKFIICGECAGDFFNHLKYDNPNSRLLYEKLYEWTGNPWLGVHPRPIEDEDFICPSCPCNNQ